ncbi:MAG: acyl-CoA synthetase, partial [Burkholderiales bacterium]|nr:acyl-CoA synthetase [Burkholderiales bacterium]
MTYHDYNLNLPRNSANHTALSPLSFLARSAQVYPDRLSVVHGTTHYTWAQTYRRCRQL